MSSTCPYTRVAVIGAGMAGAACAASLQQHGLDVTVFEKSRGVGGRMATRRVAEAAADCSPLTLAFDHGAQHFSARHPRFKAALRRAQAAGVVAPWQPRVHAAWPAAQQKHVFVALPQMSSLCRHLLAGPELQLSHPVQRLQRTGAGWQVVAVDGRVSGPFDQVVLALPPGQAALLLAGHHDRWADALAAVRMEAGWTLMAATQDLDWPWDAAEPQSGPLAWVARNDRLPGRQVLPGVATWVAHANPVWSAAHADDEPGQVVAALSKALAALLPTGLMIEWQHQAVHRWRYALPAAALGDGADCWWDARHGLGVCGDFMGAGSSIGVEAAWRSGDELADTLLAALDDETAGPSNPPETAVPRLLERDLAHAD